MYSLLGFALLEINSYLSKKKNIGNSALIIEELDWGGQDAFNTCENSFFGPHLGLEMPKNVVRLGQTLMCVARVHQNQFISVDSIFSLICNDVRLRISSFQNVADNPANRDLCERWSLPLTILKPAGGTRA